MEVCDEYPKLKYYPRKEHEKELIIHHGQRKLLLSEMMNLSVKIRLFLGLKLKLTLQTFSKNKIEGCFFDDIAKCISGMQKITLKIKEI